MLLPLSLQRGWTVKGRDVVAAFLLADLPEEEWVVLLPPKGFEADFKRIFQLKDDEDLVVVKPLYGMIQACARFAELRDDSLTGPTMQMVPSRADPALFIHKDKNGMIDAVCNPHIDDVNMGGVERTVDHLLDEFAKTMPTTGGGEAKWHLKVDIAFSKDRRDGPSSTLSLCTLGRSSRRRE